MSEIRRSITVGITGGSGACYAVRLLEILPQFYSRVDVVLSGAGRQVMATEMMMEAPANGGWIIHGKSGPGAIHVWGAHDYSAPFASGSNCAEQMVVIPCSMSTVASIAHGIDQNLLHHAAAVSIKEKKQLILVPRETPLSALHLRNMLAVAEAGATIIAAMPGFYSGQTTFDDLVNFVVQKILNHLNVDFRLSRKWGEGQTDARG